MDFRAALPIALNTVVTDTFRINPKGSQTQFRVVSEPSDDSFAIEFVPNGGTLTGAQSVQVKLTIKKPVPVKIVVSVEVARGLRHFIVVRPLSSRDVTNQAQATPNPALGRLRQPSQGSVSQNQHLASPQGLEVGPQRGNGGNVPVLIHQKLPPQAGAAPQPPVRQPRQAQSQPILQQQRQNSNPGNIPQGGVGSQIRQPGVGGGAGSGLNPLQRIFTETQPDAIFPHIPPHPHTPKTLALLRALVMSTREGLACPDIFRDRGNEAEIKGIREKLAKPGVAGSIRTRDALAIGTCIKMYLRDLPVLLCSEIPVQAVMEAKSPAIAYAAVMHMHPQNRDLLEWVLDLIVATCKLEAANGMGLRALCTVFAPNLYGPPTPAPGAEPNQQEMVKFMSASIQMVTFLGLLAAKRMSDLGV
ncbi:Rho GTPase activation protein [Chytriomyces sp. MP71]|nr:Rho GTPase activation protein [Chytriomyces sp. MP71]